MKKKGLIISTVVMVVVLIASLTTATYAWFTTSTRTTLQGFNVSVVAGNAVNIGVKADNKHKVNPADGDFRSGSVTYANGVAGQLGANGEWTGNNGLGASVTHNIVWGAQSKAVGAVNAANNTNPSTTASNYGFIGTGKFDKASTATVGKANNPGKDNKTFLNAANKGQNDATLDNVTAAYPNLTPGPQDGEPTSGDYAYLFLGVSPTQELTSNELVLLLDGTNSQMNTIGMLAAVHVAYRITKSDATAVTTEWTEVEFFEGKTQADSLVNATLTNTSWADAYQTAYDAAAPNSKASAIVISGLSTQQGAIDQIELIVYLAGADDDCIDNAKGASGEIKIFFNAVQKPSSTAPTAATVATDGKLTATGTTANTTANTTVEVQINGGAWTTINGTWTDGTFTSAAAIPNAKAGDVINVRLTETGKTASGSFTATNSMTA